MMGEAKGVFVAGTDTGVGKTFIATRLIRALVAEGRSIAAMKPVAAGAVQTPDGWRNDDALALRAAANVDAPYELVNPFCFELASSPHLAARAAQGAIDPVVIVNAYRKLAATADLVVIEGAGGWLAPIDDARTMADVAVALGVPVILVVGLRLGCLNHALLTARAIDSSGLTLAGWVANPIDASFDAAGDYPRALEERLRAPRIEIPEPPPTTP